MDDAHDEDVWNREFDRACTEKMHGQRHGSRAQPRLVEEAGHLYMETGGPGQPNYVGGAYLAVHIPPLWGDQEPNANGTILARLKERFVAAAADTVALQRLATPVPGNPL